MRLVIVLVLSLLGYNLFAEELRYSDGNGNVYRISAQKNQYILQYIPVTEAMSSSGTYSGGEPRSVYLSVSEYKNLIKFMDTIKSSGEDLPRNKGTSALSYQRNGADWKSVFPYGSKEAKLIEKNLNQHLQKNEKVDARNLMNFYQLDRSMNPWNGMSATSKQEEENLIVKPVDPSLPGLSAIDGNAFLFLNTSDGKIVVNQNYFSELHRLNVTNIATKEEKSIGHYDPNLFPDTKVLLDFLIRYCILITFIHTDAEIEIFDRQQMGDREVYQLKGVHHYYTNEKNTKEYQFKVTFFLKSGEMKVSGI
ncbi:hypothetical protein LPTSP4_18380 [Leptospira ryugenii]|uniref:Uncharacterized protein n=1 Tax=Leptospira ryugenii TaxID=1917863 RepID=A0A2P2E0A2_9LEPT|nr:hypothetical protein [Leptospira ryugenii]GBF50313.1 hypothetical protein LPTSP4_18380 [Leptospira ryugenii]